MSAHPHLLHALGTLARQQGRALDPLALDAAAAALGSEAGEAEVVRLCERLQLGSAVPLIEPDAARLPLLAQADGLGWGLVVDRTPTGLWLLEQHDGRRTPCDAATLRTLRLVAPAAAAETAADGFGALLRRVLAGYRGLLAEAGLATLFINLLALAASLFSMQVYDRVIPTRGDATLVVLTLGVALVIALECAMKFARAHVLDAALVGLDGRLSRAIFERLLAVRVDKLPGAVGTLAGQLRGYEQVRAFHTTSTLFALIDAPMALVFVVLIAALGSPWLALVPAGCALLAFGFGVAMRQRIAGLAASGAEAANRKTGLLVETVEGIETIKSGAGGWRFLSRWLDVTGRTVHNDLRLRRSSDAVAHAGAALQQASYAALVAIGAWLVMRGEMSMGALIACSILGGRVLQPIAALPGLLVQHAHCRAALQGLDGLFALETDHHGVERTLAPSRLEGRYVLEQVEFGYPGGATALRIPERLEIHAGERVGVLGPIGSGKSTLLRLLSGLYRPQAGRVLLDGLELAQIDRHALTRQLGYLQQDHRLFQGSLRDNLLIGLPDPGDDALQRALAASGLDALVARHPRGLELPIFEGGKGLSGGQRQLVAFTRLLLAEPRILLLDEPTASMDEAQERRCLSVLEGLLGAQATLVVVTHKPALLPLVDRLIVVSDQQVLMDGPRDQVLARLQPQRPPPLVAVPPRPPGLVRVSTRRL